jgi:hypothetical protein
LSTHRPVAPIPQKKTEKKNQGFEIGVEEQKTTCPAGHEPKKYTVWKNEKAAGSFGNKQSSKCSRQDIGLPEKCGKRIEVRLENDILKQRRALMKTDQFKLDMHKRNGIEGTISGITRGQGMGRSRFKGKEKSRLQIKFSGAAANISRLHRNKQATISSHDDLAA